MKICYTEHASETELWIENIYVEESGERKSSIADKLILKGEMKCYSDDGSIESELWCLNDFVLLNRDCKHLYYDGLMLCFYEAKHQLKGGWHYDGTKNFWPFVRLRYSTQKSSLLTCNGAVYISPNPASADMRMLDHQFGQATWKDTTSTGRWLFPHPEGSLAAYEHMRNTTLQEDFHRLASEIASHPEIQATFNDL